MMMRYLIQQIEQWGEDKGILPDPDKMAQWSKTHEEVQELYDAILANDKAEAKDAIGDIVVTLIMQCRAWDVDLIDCVQGAYEVIAKRQGKMVDGVFVKDVA